MDKTAETQVVIYLTLAECGFLSNWKEAEALATEEYQERVAWAIHMGILEYLNQTP